MRAMKHQVERASGDDHLIFHFDVQRFPDLPAAGWTHRGGRNWQAA
jgi:hypothetical protein